ncbi:unnamed protein product [Caenorhabditis angaria]|uniref:Mediator of RNA polymerase II transcription subunit 4 n=1 Tax=Caenorhabditis angaria TaxID=860376 RepID=A0A9P1IAZ0_9PELO|nr:unnamed protein product [Caenorhabditis angaria]
MSDDRSLRDLLLESADDLDAIVKQIIDALLNRDKNPLLRGGGETVTNMVKMFDSKQDDIRKLLVRVPEYQEREKLISELRDCVQSRDKVIQKVEMSLKACEVALTSSIFQANQKLKSVREAELRPVNSETVIKMAHQISRSYSVSAPLTWQQGDPSRPFPQESEFRNGWLLNPKPIQNHPTLQPIVKQPNQSARTPPVGRGQSPMNSQGQNQQGKVWSPRTGYGPPSTSPLVGLGRGGAITPNQMQRQSWSGGPTASTASPFTKRPTQSPLVSPSMKVKITGLSGPSSRVAPPPIRNIEQMSSDSSSSSSSEDESPK